MEETFQTTEVRMRSSPTQIVTGSRHRIILIVAVALLFALALAKFIFQDARRLEFPVNDFTTQWVSTIVFMHGKNPYSDNGEYANIWASTRVSPTASLEDYRRILSNYPRIYPPTTPLLIAPLGLLHWRTAVFALSAGSVLLLICALLVMARNLPFSWHDSRKLYFLAFALAMAPLHSGIHTVNLNTLVVACLCAGVGFLSTRPHLSGIAIGIGVCLKPQLAIFFFAYPWLRKKWKIAFSVLVTCVAITAGSLIWLRIHHLEWFTDLRAEISLCSIPPGRCSFDTADLARLQFLNLQPLIFEFTKSPTWTNNLSWALFAILAGISVVLIHFWVSDRNESAGIAIVSILTLLPVYQNTYSGEILLFAIYWAVENWPAKAAKAALLSMLLLLIPPISGLEQEVGFLGRFVNNHNLGTNVFWNGFLMLHRIWIQLFLLLLLFASLYRKPRARIESSHSAAPSTFQYQRAR
jgi:Glycosyltransferase family 87